MATVRKISEKDRPSPYENHVLIEPTAGGFRVSGVSNKNQRVVHLERPPIRILDVATAVALVWAAAHEIPEVFVIGI